MPLLRDGQITQDTWTALDDADELPGEGDVIVSYERLQKDAGLLAARKGRTGVTIENSFDPGELEAHLAHLELIALDFPAFTDGRAYSQARQLRTKHGFRGELRATGNVLADQAAFLARVGFDSFEINAAQSIDVWNKAVGSMSVAYQRGYDGKQAIRDTEAALSACGNARDCAPGEKAVIA